MMSSASANACTPSLALPLAAFFVSFCRCAQHAISNAPAPGTTDSSSIAFLTERKPSLIASLIWAIVYALGPANQYRNKHEKYNTIRRTLDKQSNTLCVLDFFDKGEFLLTQSVLVYQSSIAQYIRGKILDRILSLSTADQLQSVQHINQHQSKRYDKRRASPCSSSLPF